ncbi:hypothetical protein [Methanothrix soehngenii]|uniref:hypothetical protein n=1 Tax=Methanothrix soehngenii TaxID=2223 RepID=UPI00300D4AA5
MESLHPTLRRQLARLGVDPGTAPADPEVWRALLLRVSKAYEESAQDRYLLKRSLSTVSAEMAGLNAELKSRAESRVAAERDRLEAMISALSDGFVSLELDGSLHSWNPAAEALLGPLQEGEELLPFLHLSEGVPVDVRRRTGRGASPAGPAARRRRPLRRHRTAYRCPHRC